MARRSMLTPLSGYTVQGFAFHKIETQAMVQRTLVNRTFELKIRKSVVDGKQSTMINGNLLCSAIGKIPSHYLRLTHVKAYKEVVLKGTYNLTDQEIAEYVGDMDQQTWFHPSLALLLITTYSVELMDKCISFMLCAISGQSVSQKLLHDTRHQILGALDAEVQRASGASLQGAAGLLALPAPPTSTFLGPRAWQAQRASSSRTLASRPAPLPPLPSLTSCAPAAPAPRLLRSPTLHQFGQRTPRRTLTSAPSSC